MASGIGVERRNSNQSVNTVFGLQVAVCERTFKLKCAGFDSGPVTICSVDLCHLHAVTLSPSDVHAHEHLGPILGIHAAVTRCRPDGTPSPEGWYPAQRLSVQQAVHAYTMGAAYASGEEAIKGSLTPGKLADLVVLDRDIFEINPAQIHETGVVATMLGGEFVYQRSIL